MFTLNDFPLYNAETFFSSHFDALSYCSTVTPKSSKTITTIQKNTFSIGLLLCFTMVSSIISSEQTVLVLSDGTQEALNLHATHFLFPGILSHIMYLRINSATTLSSSSSIFGASTVWLGACICSVPLFWNSLQLSIFKIWPIGWILFKITLLHDCLKTQSICLATVTGFLYK